MVYKFVNYATVNGFKISNVLKLYLDLSISALLQGSQFTGCTASSNAGSCEGYHFDTNFAINKKIY